LTKKFQIEIFNFVQKNGIANNPIKIKEYFMKNLEEV